MGAGPTVTRALRRAAPVAGPAAPGRRFRAVLEVLRPPARAAAARCEAHAAPPARMLRPSPAEPAPVPAAGLGRPLPGRPRWRLGLRGCGLGRWLEVDAAARAARERLRLPRGHRSRGGREVLLLPRRRGRARPRPRAELGLGVAREAVTPRHAWKCQCHAGARAGAYLSRESAGGVATQRGAPWRCAVPCGERGAYVRAVPKCASAAYARCPMFRTLTCSLRWPGEGSALGAAGRGLPRPCASSVAGAPLPRGRRRGAAPPSSAPVSRRESRLPRLPAR